MSKLEDLIAKLCPNGVEYKALSEVSDMKRGTTVTKKSVNPGDIPVISGGREPAYYCDISNRNGETITVAGSGAGAGFVQYWDKPIFVCDAFSVKGIDDLTSTKFLYYVLLSKQEAIYATKKGGGVPHVHISSIKDFEIPVPPLDVQAEIVRILDTFTELTTKLTENLTAELTARKKQYEFYRDDLLKFDNESDELIQKLCPNGVDKIKLNEICKIYDGTHSTPQYKESGVKFVSVENINDLYSTTKYISEEDFDKYKIKPQIGDVFMTRIGSIGICNVVDRDEKLAYYVSLALLRPNTAIINSRYLKYAIESIHGRKELRKRTLVNAVPIKINKDDIGKVQLPVPPLEVQREIVRILDTFTELTENLTAELTAELTARSKQYEYYRDQLLNFKRA